MITSTFLFLPGIGKQLERKLWQQGILSWDDFLAADTIKGIGRKSFYDTLLRKAKKALYEEDMAFFTEHFPLAEHWRLYAHFRADAVFLDIEVEHVTGDLSVVGLYDGYDTKIMVNGVNLDLTALQTELKKYKLIITYNGSTFDVPYLRKRFPQLLPLVPCFDVKVGCRRLGLVGGLKEVERTLGIKRANPLVEKIAGGDPAKLYRMWKGSGDPHYLHLLVEYNEEDVINLKQIAELVSKQLTESLNAPLSS